MCDRLKKIIRENELFLDRDRWVIFIISQVPEIKLVHYVSSDFLYVLLQGFTSCPTDCAASKSQ